MKRRLLILMIFLLPTILFGQKKYKFKYKQHLTSQPSSYTTQLSDTILELDKSNLTFLILDKKGEAVLFANITIKGGVTDSTIHSDINGFATITLPSDTYSISILEFQSTPIIMDSFEAKGNTKMTIKTSLGQSNALGITLIYSKRKLTDNEIEKIVDDLSNDRDENDLIKNKTCYIMWEI